MLDCWRNILRILKGSAGPGVADPPSGRVQVDAGQEGGEFGGGHLDAIGRGGREAEGPAFESLGPDGQAVAVPIQDLDAIASLVDEDEEMTGEGIEGQAARCQGGQSRRSSCACRPVRWRGKRGLRRSVQTWAFLHDGDETAEGLGVESGSDGDPTSIGKDQFEVGWGGSDRRDGIGKDGDREEVVVGTGGGTIVARGRARDGRGW